MRKINFYLRTRFFIDQIVANVNASYGVIGKFSWRRAASKQGDEENPKSEIQNPKPGRQPRMKKIRNTKYRNSKCGISTTDLPRRARARRVDTNEHEFVSFYGALIFDHEWTRMNTNGWRK